MLLLRLWPISVFARVAASDKVDQEEDGANDRQEHPEEVETRAARVVKTAHRNCQIRYKRCKSVDPIKNGANCIATNCSSSAFEDSAENSAYGNKAQAHDYIEQIEEPILRTGGSATKGCIL